MIRHRLSEFWDEACTCTPCAIKRYKEEVKEQLIALGNNSSFAIDEIYYITMNPPVGLVCAPAPPFNEIK